MGAWGEGPFDNDDAGDWVHEFDGLDEAAGVQVLLDALDLGDAGEYIEVPEGAVAVAAAAIVSWLREPSTILISPYCEAAAAWVRSTKPPPNAVLDAAALSALDRVRSDRSELALLWAESDDEAWQGSLAQIENRVRAQGIRRFSWVPGGAIDPTEYQGWLAVHGGELPAGALAFAAHPSHFDYLAYRVGDEPLPPETPLCPKDLLLHQATWAGEQDSLVLHLMFPGYDPSIIGTFDLTITYRNVVSFRLDHRRGAPTRSPIKLGGLMADEVAPSDAGVVHHLDFECGSIAIDSADLMGLWR